MPLRRTKIIATLGPATDAHDQLEKILLAGVDVVRLNFSHGLAQDHIDRAQRVRTLSKKLGHEVGILADLQGPKIRIARFKKNTVHLVEGQAFILDANLPKDQGDETTVGIDYPTLPAEVVVQDILLLDDGRIILEVTKIAAQRIYCKVVVGGPLSNNKGINRQGGGLSAKSLTDKDREDLKTAVQIGADYIAISFPRCAADIEEARTLITQAGGSAGIVAKIERTEAVAAIDEIIRAADAVMIARGDLGVEIGDAELPGVQKHIIHQARSLDKIAITATQMMESMIENTIPTRAEVFDVANAVLDGTDAVMLSAETATGKHPEKVVQAMARICIGAEKELQARTSKHRVEMTFQRVDEAIAMAAMYTANHLNIKAIVALTESGSTPLWMSRIRSGISIFGLTRSVSTQRRMTLMRGVYPMTFDITQVERHAINAQAVETVKNKGYVHTDDLVILTKGDLIGVHGGANALKIVRVGQVV